MADLLDAPRPSAAPAAAYDFDTLRGSLPSGTVKRVR
jgi:hypothetical protein